MPKVKINLDPSDPHWVNLVDPLKRATDLGDRWRSNCPLRSDPRPYIIIKIPEILNKFDPKITIRWASNDWHGIGVSKSKDQSTWTPLWQRREHYVYVFDESYTIPLDPTCEYYKIDFMDGNYSSEWTDVYKKCILTYENQNYIYESKTINIAANSILSFPDIKDQVKAYLTFSWCGKGQSNISFEKSSNGQWTSVWKEKHDLPHCRTVTIELDPACTEYRISTTGSIQLTPKAILSYYTPISKPEEPQPKPESGTQTQNIPYLYILVGIFIIFLILVYYMLRQ